MVEPPKLQAEKKATTTVGPLKPRDPPSLIQLFVVFTPMTQILPVIICVSNCILLLIYLVTLLLK